MTNFTHKPAPEALDEHGVDINAHGARLDALVKARLGHKTQLIGVIKITEFQQNDGVTMEQHYIVCCIRDDDRAAMIHKAMLDSKGATMLVTGEFMHEPEHRGLAYMIDRAFDQQYHMRVAFQNIQKNRKKARR